MHQQDGGLARDLSLTLSRRRALGLLGATGAGALLPACDFLGPPGHAEPNLTAFAADGTVCMKMPSETAGPFPADGTNRLSGAITNVLTQSGVIRSDIRSSFGGLQGTASGSRLDLAIQLVDVRRACAPLAGYLVYIWSCDARGKYSLYEIADCNYLRGAGVTNAEGSVTLTTVFPGCYPGRWPHIHFEVFASAEKAGSGRESLLTSQFAFPADVCNSLYGAGGDYVGSGKNLAKLSIATDGIFRDSTPEQIAAQTLKLAGDAETGYNSTVIVGVAA